MATDTGAQAGVTADVEARAREALARGISPYFWGKALDDISEAGGSVGSARRDSLRQADYVMGEFPAAGLRIVDAAADDRRTAELAAGRELVHALVQWDMCAGKGTCNEAFVRIKAARRGFAPYLHDDDTGGEG